MKVSFQASRYNNPQNNKINFGAYRPSVNNHGEREHNFYVAYDAARYDAVLELYEAKKQNGLWHADVHKPVISIPMEENGIALKMSDLSNSIYENYAYKYKLINKNNPNDVRYVLDNGTKTEEKGSPDAANVLYSNRGIFEQPKNAILIMPDMFHQVRYEGDYKGTNIDVRGIPKNTLRTHSGMLGGNFEGIMEKLPQLKDEGYTKIVGTPFTKDAVSSHKYWTQNAYQLAPSLGNEEDFKRLQQMLVENGMSWIADGAFVNEGLQGVHFRSVLKWGDKSPFKDWFYLTNGELEPVTVGILPDTNNDNINFKLVNPKYHILQDAKTKEIILERNEDWQKDKPTYVQFYDKRLINSGDDNDKRLITSYGVNSLEKTSQISTVNDTISPYFFEIDPEQLADNVIRRNAYSSRHPNNPDSDLQSIDTMKALFSFDNFKIDRKRMGGYICWDGNIDIPKLNLHVSNSDIQEYDNPDATHLESIKINGNGTYSVEIASPIVQRYIGALQVKDYMVKAGKYWTGLTRDIQVQHVAQMLGKQNNYVNRIETLVSEKKLPESIYDSVTPEIVTNVVNGDYENNNAPIGRKKELILEAMQTLPLDSLNISDEIMASLSSPYISLRPFSEDDVNKTRNDVAEDKYRNIPDEYRDVYEKFDKTFRTELLEYIEEVVDIANKYSEGALYDSNAQDPVVSEFGAEVIKMMVPQITKKVLEYAIAANFIEDPENEPAESFGYRLSLVPTYTPQSFGIQANSPKEEAQKVVNKLVRGIKLISNDDIDCFDFYKHYMAKDMTNFAVNVDMNTLNLAKVIVDRSETGLGWRIDAAKDISNFDDVREGIGRFDDTWDNVVKTWAEFVEGVRQENPNAYITAEVTDLNYFLDRQNSQGASLSLQKYDTEEKAELEFIEKTGVTSLANYKYLYSGIKDIFLPSNETGIDNKIGIISDDDEYNPAFRESKFIKAWYGNRSFLDHGPYDAITGAYNFYENHDKPRILHTAALNMHLFHGSFIDGEKCEENRRIAQKVFSYAGKNLSEYDYHLINPKAVAMADRLNKAVNTMFGFGEEASDDEIYNYSKGKIDNSDIEFIKNFKKATAELASGLYKGNKFNAAAFGVRPFELVLEQVFEQMAFDGYEIEEKDKKQFKKDILTEILTPACDDAYRIYKYMSTMPGMITDFAGHKQGASGYESKKNNLYQQNRNRINWEWTDSRFGEENIPVVRDFMTKINTLLELRKDKDLSALSDGDTVLLPKDGENKNIMSLFRYNDKGSKIISVYNPTRDDRQISRILLNNDTEGIIGGLKAGMTFVNAEDISDECVYKVLQYPNGHCFIAKFWNEQHYENAKNNPDEFLKIDIKGKEGNVLVLKCLNDTENKTTLKNPSFCGLQSYITYNNHINKKKNINIPKTLNCVS